MSRLSTIRLVDFSPAVGRADAALADACLMVFTPMMCCRFRWGAGFRRRGALASFPRANQQSLTAHRLPGAPALHGARISVTNCLMRLHCEPDGKFCVFRRQRRQAVSLPSRA